MAKGWSAPFVRSDTPGDPINTTIYRSAAAAVALYPTILGTMADRAAQYRIWRLLRAGAPRGSPRGPPRHPGTSQDQVNANQSATPASSDDRARQHVERLRNDSGDS